MRWLSFLFVILACPVVGIRTPGQKASEAAEAQVQRLLQELSEPRTTDAAAQRILELGSIDQQARKYVVRNLPPMIRGRAPDKVWINAVHLAGSLKAIEAIPSLIEAISRNVTGGTVSIGEYMRLDTDPVGKALAEIGDPSVPEVTKLLDRGDRNTRGRAALILVNIDSPSSRQALKNHIPHESDPGIRDLIESRPH